MKFKRAAKESAGMLSNIILLLGIAVALQYISYRHPHEWDYTKNQQFSLSPLSKQVLAELKSPLDIWVFAHPEDKQTKDIIHQYEVASSQVKTHFIDPNSEPAKAQEFGIKGYPPLLIINYGSSKEQISQLDEERITNTVNRLISGTQRTVYFLQGSGEGNPNASESEGYSVLRDALQAENFTVKPLALFQGNKIQATGTSIIIANPRYPLQEKERQILEDYLGHGGHVLFLCGVNTHDSWLGFLKSFGVTVNDDLVIDPSIPVLGGNAEFLLTNNYFSHAITDPFLGLKKIPDPLFMPLTRSLGRVDNKQKNIKIFPLVETRVSGISIPTKREGRRLLLNVKAKSKPQVIPVVEAVTLKSAKNPDDESLAGQLVVTGSALFAQNKWIADYANRDFLLNSVSWLTNSKNTIAIHPKVREGSPFMMDSKSLASIFFISVVGLPGFGILLGLGNWLRRRSL